MPWRPSLLALVIAVASGIQTNTQTPCTASFIPIPVTRAKVALTEAQEADLGDAVAEHMERTYQVVRGDVNDYLQHIGDRIVAELPPTNLRFKFTLINPPEVNAFATPGGRVYVSRKLVAFAANEDELAGVVGHEIGHIITRQIAADLTAAFRRTLRVTTFGDRQDIFEKYHRLLDASTSARRDDDRHHDDDQYEADRVALLAVSRAGYSPDAYVELWDRFAETNHSTGNFFSDLIGETRPESKRLREMLSSMHVVGAGCRAVTAQATDEFKAWQKKAIESTGDSGKGAIRAVVREQKLEPPLHPDITSLRFSPDGHYVLAQDESSIYVLGRQPFEVLFRIEADSARPANFTPDSTKVVFSTPGLRVEWWNIASRSREGAFELVARDGAIDSALSPDGRWLAYLNLAPAIGTFRIHLLDVQMGVEVLEKRISSVEGMLKVQGTHWTHDLDVFELAFSPDGRYFLAGGDPHTLVIELATKAEVKLPDPMRDAMQQRFAFLGPDRLVTLDAKHPERSAILRFPSGEPLKTLQLAGHVTAAAHGDFLLIRPIKDWPVGLLDLTAGRITLASKTPALDAYDDVRVSEMPNGDIGLFRSLSREPESSVTLPASPLGGLIGGTVSSDLARVALSGHDRGGVWDMTTGHRITHVRGFMGADIEDGSTLYADFPSRKEIRDGKLTAIDRLIARVDLNTGSSAEVLTVGETAAELKSRYYATLTPEKPGEWDHNVTFEVRDVTTNAVLWTRHFTNQPPWLYYDLGSDRVIFEWDATSAGAKIQLKEDEALRQAADAPELKDGASLLEVIRLADGRPAGRLMVATGRTSFAGRYYIKRVQRVVSSGDIVVVLDRNNQSVIYSMSSGLRLGTLFGRFAVVSDAAGLIAIQNAADELQCYDAKTLARRAELHLGSRVHLARFSGDGKRLLVVTADQVARLLDTQALTSPDLPAR